MKAIQNIPMRPLYFSLIKPKIVEGRLVTLRHGESKYNEEGKWAGWADPPLTEKGILQAKQAGKFLREKDFRPKFAYTTKLHRAFNTAEIVLHSMGIPLSNIDIRIRTALMERHCGAYTGMSKKKVLEEYGEQQYTEYRRSYDFQPPPMSEEHLCHPNNKDKSDKVVGMPSDNSGSESLKQVDKRVAQFWESELLPQLQAGNDVLVVAHTHSLRMLEKNILGLTPKQVENGPEVHNATPTFYRFSDNKWMDCLPTSPISLTDR